MSHPPRNPQPTFPIPPYIPLLIFIAALLPRLYALDTFLTIDEVKWAEGAGQFLLALQSGNLAQTYWHFFPGITTTWGAALVLWGLCLPSTNLTACVTTQVAHLPQSIGWLRLSTALWTSLGVTGVYLLTRRLLNHRLALLTALLLAFDPFYLAHSRILNGDALAAVLMFLSLLAFLLYRASTLRQFKDSTTSISNPLISNLQFILPSAILTGLALLTKLPAPIIGVFTGGLGLVFIAIDYFTGRRSAILRRVAALAVWGIVALLVFVILWPAMWVAPLQTLHQMYVDAFEVGGAGKGHLAFFMGRISPDPGPWFYPYVIAFRLTPVVSLGLLLTLGWLTLPLVYVGLKLIHHFIHPWPGQATAGASRFLLAASRLTLRLARLASFDQSQATTAMVMLAYVISVILLANASPKKLDRYVMGVIPPLILLSTIGMDIAVRLIAHVSRFTFHALRLPPLSTLLTMLLAGVQLLFAILASPYYLTYYNPLLGGPMQAAATAPVGWGEGLERAAHYLNSRPNADTLTASSWYNDIFQPYFVGRKASFSDDGRSQLAADYMVFYVNQIQRQKPYLGLVDYFRRGTPEFVVAVTPTGGVVATTDVLAVAELPHWVEVYKSPAAQSASGAPKIEGVAQLLAYNVTGSNGTDEATITLFLRVLGPLPQETVIVAGLTQNASSNAHYTAQSPEITGDWQTGNIVEWHGRLSLPPGEYRLWAGLQNSHGALPAAFEISPKDPPIVIVE